MTADNNSTEDKPDPTPFKVYPDECAQQAHAGRARQGNLPPRSRGIKFAGRQVGGYYAVYQRGRKIWP